MTRRTTRQTTRQTTALGIGLGLAVILGACGDDGDGVSAPTTRAETTTEAETTSSSTEPASTEVVTTTEATTDPAPPPDTTPADEPLPGGGRPWAAELVRAWGAGDRDRAAQLATPEVVDQLFGHATPGGGDWDLLSCDSTALELFCTFTSAARSESVVTEQGGDRPIATVRFDSASTEVPPELPTEADALVRAWGAGDREAAAAHAQESVVDVLFGFADPGGRTWERTRCLTFHGDDPLCVYEAPDRAERVILHLGGGSGPAIGFAFVDDPG